MSMPRPKFIRPGGTEDLYTRSGPGIAEDGGGGGGRAEAAGPGDMDEDSHTSFLYNRYHHLPVQAQRQKLPVFQYRNHILYLLERHQTLVLVGETGSGKSTQVPQASYYHGKKRWRQAESSNLRKVGRKVYKGGLEEVAYDHKSTVCSVYLAEVGHAVCVTQPRSAAAVALAARVASERGATGGGGEERVGYAAGMQARRPHDADIVFVTEGVLLREMMASPLLTQYSCIVLDEVHERTQLTDVLMGLLKKIAKKRKKLKLVISSATMDADFIKQFFNVNPSGERSAVALSVQGRTHPIDVFYVQEPVANYVKATVETVIRIHETKPFGDILAFLTSQEEIMSALETLETYAAENNDRNKHRKQFAGGMRAHDMTVLPMYGSLPHHRQLKVFQMADRNVRKVVIATNIAETSVTIPGVSYVIDCGFHKLPYYEPSVGVECVSVCCISKANAAQRAGRAGRTSRGECYRLYTEAEFDKMAAAVPPEMQRSELSSILLQLKALGIHNVLRFAFPTPPPAKTLLSGLELLLSLGAIDKTGQLTEGLGRHMAELPLRPSLAKLLCGSGEYGCIEQALSIVAMLHVDNVFSKPRGGAESIKARLSRRNNFEVAEGDLVTYLNVFDAYTRIADAAGIKHRAKACRAWCQRMYVNDKVMEKVSEIRKSLEKLVKYKFQLQDKKLDGLEFGTAKTERLLRCVTSAMFPSACRLTASGAYESVARGARLSIAPDSCLHDAPPPQWVVYGSVQCTGDKTYMRDVTAINKAWLLEVAPHYYTQT